MSYRYSVVVLLVFGVQLLAACGSAATQAAPTISAGESQAEEAATTAAATLQQVETQAAPTAAAAATQYAPTAHAFETQFAPTLAAASSAAAPTPGAGLAVTGAVDACSLVTAQEAGDALGASIGGPASRQAKGIVSSCQYTAGGMMVSVTALHFPGVSEAAAFFQSELTNAKSDSTLSPVSGLGEQAYQAANGVVVMQHGTVMMINVFFNPDVTAQVNREKAISLAEAAVKRLP